MSWKLAASAALFLAALIYLVAKLWRRYDAEGRAQPLWKRGTW
ncbi:MAG TPA: hypothetical protein VF678_16265 [bacterium]